MARTAIPFRPNWKRMRFWFGAKRGNVEMAENDKEDFRFVQIFTNNAGMLVGGGIRYMIILCLNWCQVNIAEHSAFAVAAHTPGVDLPAKHWKRRIRIYFFFFKIQSSGPMQLWSVSAAQCLSSMSTLSVCPVDRWTDAPHSLRGENHFSPNGSIRF